MSEVGRPPTRQSSLFDRAHPKLDGPPPQVIWGDKGFAIGGLEFEVSARQQRTIMKYFLSEENRNHWHNITTLHSVFSTPGSPYFVGVSYDRILRFVHEKNLLTCEYDKSKHNGTKRWRLAEHLRRLFG
jgi:hypothetical protein